MASVDGHPQSLMEIIPTFMAGVAEELEPGPTLIKEVWQMTDDQEAIAVATTSECFICDTLEDLLFELRGRNPSPVVGAEYALLHQPQYQAQQVLVFKEPVLVESTLDNLLVMAAEAKRQGVLVAERLVDKFDGNGMLEKHPGGSWNGRVKLLAAPLYRGVCRVRLADVVARQQEAYHRRKYMGRKNKAQIDLGVIDNWIYHAEQAVTDRLPCDIFKYVVKRQHYSNLVSKLEARRMVLAALLGPRWLIKCGKMLVRRTAAVIEFMPWVLKAEDDGYYFMVGIRRAIRAAYRAKHPVGTQLMAAMRRAEMEWRAQNKPKRKKHAKRK